MPDDPDFADDRAPAPEDLDDINDVAHLLQDVRFIRFLRRVFIHAGVMQTTFDPDTHVMAARAGRRDMGIWIVKQINAIDPSVTPRILGDIP